MPTNKIRVIVDTNIWISSLIGRQLLYLRELLSYPQIELVVTDRLIQEVIVVAQRPKFAKYFPQDEVTSLIEFMQLIGEEFTPNSQLQLCRDKADDLFCKIVSG